MSPVEIFTNFLKRKQPSPLYSSRINHRSRSKQNQVNFTSAVVEILEDRTLLDASNPGVTLSSDVTEIGEYWKIPTFTATLSEVGLEDVTVNLGFSGTATEGVDYGAWQSYILVTAGNLTGTVQIQSIPDDLIEGDETIITDIISVDNGTELGDQSVTVTINDDDTPDPGTGPIPDVTLSVDMTEITEYWKVPTFTATLSEVTTEDVLVNLGFSGTATTGSDYGAWQSYILVTAGNLTGTVQVQSIPDDLIEGDETIITEITSVANGTELGNQSVTVTINDDDTPDPGTGPIPDVSLSVDMTEITEYWKVPTFTATLSEVTTEDVLVNLGFSGTATTGSDYGAWQSYILVTAGNLTGTVQIQSIPDDLIEGDETIIIEITSVANGTELGDQSVTVTINDDDTPDPGTGPIPDVTLSVDMTEITEYWKVPTFTATLSEVTTEDVLVNLGFSGTATEGVDYGAWQSYILVTAGNLTGTVQIQSISDTLNEGDETIVVDVTSVVNGNEDAEQSVVVTVTDTSFANPNVILSADVTSIDEDSRIATVTATLNKVAVSDVIVELELTGTATENTDFTISATQIVILAGQLTGSSTVQVQALQDSLVEPDETIGVKILSATNADIKNGIQELSVLINDDDVPSVTLSTDVTQIDEDESIATITATLDQISHEDVTVTLGFTGTATDTVDYAATANQIVITAGNLTGTIQVQSAIDTLVEVDETVIVDVTGVTNGMENGTQTVTVTILDNDLPKVTLSSDVTQIDEDESIATITATLDQISHEDVTVTLGFTGTATDTVDYTPTASQIIITAGNLTGTIQVQSVIDTLFENSKTIQVDITGVTNGMEDGTQTEEVSIIDGFNSSIFNLSILESVNGGDGTQGFILNGIDQDDHSGFSVSSAGDINGDGFDDIIIGANTADPNGNSDAGENYVVFGKANGYSASIDLSSLNGTNGFVINGINVGDTSGWSVSSAGDINGDGFDDIIIDSYFADPNGNNNAGESYVIFGKASGYTASIELSSLDGTNGFVINGIDDDDLSGFSVSSAGDVNGDGFDDLIIGAPGASESYVLFGKSTGYSASINLSTLNGANGFVINGIDSGDSSGRSVSSAGDVNGDGFDDIIIGAHRADPNGNSQAGESYVLFGKASGYTASVDLSSLNGTNGYVINGIDASDQSGLSVSSAGDINGDGFDEIIIGAWQADPNGNLNAGESYVIFGKASGYAAALDLSSLNGTNGFVINGIDEDDLSGVSVSSAGDINGDGFDDLIIGAHHAIPNGKLFAGESYVLFGKSTGYTASINLSSLNGTNGFVINGIDTLDQSGHSVSSAGDINGDGFDDIIIGADTADINPNNDVGESYVIFGRDFRNEGTAPITKTGTSSDEILIGGLGDDTIDGGSGDDVIKAGAGNDTILYDPATDTLKVDGGSGEDTLSITGTGISLNLTTLNQTEFYQLYENIEVIDLTGSGNNTLTLTDFDLLHLSSTTNTLRVDGNAGDAVISAPPIGLWIDQGTTVINSETYHVYQLGQAILQVHEDIDRSGISLSMPELNLSDLLTANGGDGSQGFILNGIDTNDHSGWSVSSAGDINGDGFDDIIIGARNADSNVGESYIVFGKASGYTASIDLSSLNGTNGFVINGIDADDQTGFSVSSAGDINGDGLDDLIIGANEADSNGKNKAGESYVIFGKTNGYSASINLSTLNGTNGFVINGIDNNDRSGVSVSSAGDINGDGFDDIIIGASQAWPNAVPAAGESYVIFGKATGYTASFNLTSLNGTNGFVINGIDPSDNSGHSVSSAGDVNGDGFNDIIIGAFAADLNGNSQSGESYIVFGKANGYSASINLSTLDGTNGFIIIGIDAGDDSGYSVSSAGDINGDGLDDIIIGAESADPNGVSGAGESYVLFGKANGYSASVNLSSLNGFNGFVINGIDTGDFSGLSVSSAGDINGDGFDDIIIGAYIADPGGKFNAGESYIIFGRDFRNEGTTPVTKTGTSADEILIGGLGDDTIDGGSGDDVIKAGAGDDTILYDPATDTLKVDGGSGEDTLQITGTGIILNLSVLNQSEFYNLYENIEVIDITGSGNNTLTLGVLDVLKLSNSTNTLRIDGNSGDQVFTTGTWTDQGTTVINSETYHDYQSGQAVIQVHEDMTYSVIESEFNLSDLQSANGGDGSQGFIINGVDSGDNSGNSVNSAGDINGDGFDDIIIGGSGNAITNAGINVGESYVVFGKASGHTSEIDLSSLNGTNGFIIRGIDPGDASSRSVSSAGDMNGDGFDDIIIGAWQADPNGNLSAGESYIFFGKSTGYAAVLDLSTLNGTNGFVINGIDQSDTSGYSVNSTGDINGDSFDDIIISAVWADPNGNSNAGESYVVFGKATGYTASFNLSSLLSANGGDGSQGFIINGIDEDDQVGSSVGSAGDVNGDGYDDIIIGAYSADPNSNSFAGESYVVFGKASGYSAEMELSDLLSANGGDGSEGFIINGIDETDQSGRSVSSAGDINGDGFDDIIIGAYTADPNGISSAGESYVLFGKLTGYTPTIELSSLNGNNGFVINGINNSDRSGFSVSSAGDINGDGYDDIIIGAYQGDPNGVNDAGESYVIFGRDFRNEVTHLGTTGNDTQTGTSADEIFIGGLGNDTIDGGSGDDVIKAGAGNDTIIYDPATDTLKVDGGSGEDTLQITGTGISLNLSVLNQSEFYSLYENIEIIDITGSGNNTLTLGVLDALKLSTSTNTLRIDGNSGNQVFTTGTWTTQGTTVINSETYHVYQSGQAIIQVHEDMTYSILESEFNLSDLQSANGGDGSQGFILDGIDINDQFGTSVSSAGDINGDGFDDFIIGTPLPDLGTGETYVIFGKASGYTASMDLSSLNGTNGFIINGILGGDGLGASVSSAGDMNGDGFADIIIGAIQADPSGNSNAGESYVVFGKASGYTASLDLSTLNGTNGFVINGIDATDFSGRSVSSAGDINGDGFDDIIIGADFADPNSNSLSGESYVVFGKATGYTASINLSSLNGTNGFVINGIDANDRSGRSVSSAGDINGDGFDDIIIGAYGANSSTGATYLLFGKATGYTASIELSSLNGTNGFVVNGINISDLSGFSVSSAGDINGDGFDDILIGATEGDPNAVTNSGESYVIFGKAFGYTASFNLSSLFGTNGFVINGIDDSDLSGRSVSSAGDINGDGFDDILIGAKNADPNGNINAGESYVLFGKESGYTASVELSSLNGTNGFVINGIDLGDFSGNSVSSAGDINGDGFDDIIIGSFNADPNGNSNAGESYVIFGRDFRNEGINPLVASGSSRTTSNSVPLTNEDLQPVLDEAIARWSIVVDPALFDHIQVSIADLDGQLLGREQNGKIVIDINAAGFGWFIDTTPEDDSEFQYEGGTGHLLAVTSEASGKMDLLSVLMHELGHAIGLEHDEIENHMMNSQLEAGVRTGGLNEVDDFFGDESQLAVVLNS